MLSGYWDRCSHVPVSTSAYLATKHWCVHYMHAELSLPPRVIAERMGWTLAGEAAGHARPRDGALDEIDKAPCVSPIHRVSRLLRRAPQTASVRAGCGVVRFSRP
jgi:hypothetical protein